MLTTNLTRTTDEDTGSRGAWVTSTTTATPGSTTQSDGIDSFYFYETEQFVFLWILFTVIVLGNSAVLVTLFLHRARKSRMNFFIKQLALADLSVGLLNVLTDIVWRLTVEWRAGNVACKVIKFLQVGVTYASTYVLVALSIDRYDAITHPMNFSGSWRRARRLVGAAWALSALFSLPMFYLYETRTIEDQTQCWIELGSPAAWKLYMSLVSVALFVLPALIISACYAVILRTIWAKGAILGHSDRRRRGRGGSNSSEEHSSRRASSRGLIPRAKVKTVKVTIVIVIVFILCWSPYIVFDLLQVFGQIPRTQTNLAVATFVQSLAPLNSAANPLIYCLFSAEVGRTLRRLPPFRWLPWCSCRGQERSSGTQDSVRTLTTSLAVSTRRSTLSSSHSRKQRVTIVERPKTILMSPV